MGKHTAHDSVSGTSHTKPVASRQESTPTSKLQLGSCRGAGTLEILNVVKILNEHDITCCIVGVGALRYYGASRVRLGWEICVPEKALVKATRVLTNTTNKHLYETLPPEKMQIYSLLHTFPRFRVTGYAVSFYLVPSDDCHFECTPSNLEYSKMGLPYPKLNVYVQSLLDTLDTVSLQDVIDGMDLDDEWASQNIDLTGTQDTIWAKGKNEKMEASLPEMPLVPDINEEPFPIKTTWDRLVATKSNRIGPEYPPGMFKTRFRHINDGDPRLEDRTGV